MERKSYDNSYDHVFKNICYLLHGIVSGADISPLPWLKTKHLAYHGKCNLQYHGEGRGEVISLCFFIVCFAINMCPNVF